ncbi:MAG: hypothetical protein H0Z32_11645 [Bacillaceae bacterium]|nr:hypothetical protein [Bacillaceae bacterium]
MNNLRWFRTMFQRQPLRRFQMFGRKRRRNGGMLFTLLSLGATVLTFAFSRMGQRDNANQRPNPIRRISPVSPQQAAVEFSAELSPDQKDQENRNKNQ